MPLAFRIGLGLAGVVALEAAVWQMILRRQQKHREILGPPAAGRAPHPAPRVSVLVAAKDEEDAIEVCVRALLDQDYPDYEVIAVDDRSRDGTGPILQRLADEAAGRLRVVKVSDLPQGWCGKNNAMHAGVAQATGEWLLFTDADCRLLSRDAVSAGVGYAIQHGLDYLSVLPDLEMTTVWERIVQPAASLMLLFWFPLPQVNDPAKPAAFGTGQYMLMSRDGYHRVGGHERVRGELNEDVHLARLVKRAGLGLRVVENDGLLVSHMYRSLGEAFRGWSRIYSGCVGSVPRLAGTAAYLFFFSVLPTLALIVMLAGGLAAADGTPWLVSALAWAAAIAMQQACLWRLYAMAGFGRPWSLTYSMGIVFVLAMIFRAILATLGLAPTTWRGTTYRRAVL